MKFLKVTTSVFCFVAVAGLCWVAWQLYAELHTLAPLTYPLLGVALLLVLGCATWPKDSRKRRQQELKKIMALQEAIHQIHISLQLIVFGHPVGVDREGAKIPHWTAPFIEKAYPKGIYKDVVGRAAAAMQAADQLVESLSLVGGPKGWHRRTSLRLAQHHVNVAKHLLGPIAHKISFLPPGFLKQHGR